MLRRLARLLLASFLFAIVAGCASGGGASLVDRLDRARFEPQESGTDASLRAVSVVSPDVAWASGSDGTVIRTVDGGATWTSVGVPGAAELDFRGLHARDARTAWVVSAGLPARLYRTDDGGRTWSLQLERREDGVFFDGLAFFDDERGLAFSDPVGGHLLVVRTADGGRTWHQVPEGRMPRAAEGEAVFAASNTCLAVHGDDHAWIGLGGTTVHDARMFRSTDGGATWAVTVTPMRSGRSAGIFSIAFRDARNGVAVGGDFFDQTNTSSTAMVTTDGGSTWQLVVESPPGGYRSVVRWLPGFDAVAIAGGVNGVDYSVDGGRSWRRIDDLGFHALDFAPDAPDAPVGWSVGANGRVAVFRLPR
jgi:photosystem II stability/assembly factor-like uncharacterized protein